MENRLTTYEEYKNYVAVLKMLKKSLAVTAEKRKLAQQEYVMLDKKVKEIRADIMKRLD